MIATLKQMLPRIESWPAEDQDALAEAARQIESRRTGVYAMTADEAAAVDEGLAQADRDEFAPDDEVAALWKKYMAV